MEDRSSNSSLGVSIHQIFDIHLTRKFENHAFPIIKQTINRMLYRTGSKTEFYKPVIRLILIHSSEILVSNCSTHYDTNFMSIQSFCLLNLNYQDTTGKSQNKIIHFHIFHQNCF